MPLARFALYESGVEIYLASTADDGDGVAGDARPHRARVARVRRRARALPARPAYPDDFPLREVLDGHDVIGRGGSAILAPDGSYLAGPLYDEEGILYAELDPARLWEERQRFDPAGHYHRPDVFLTVNAPCKPFAEARYPVENRLRHRPGGRSPHDRRRRAAVREGEPRPPPPTPTASRSPELVWAHFQWERRPPSTAPSIRRSRHATAPPLAAFEAEHGEILDSYWSTTERLGDPRSPSSRRRDRSAGSGGTRGCASTARPTG